MFHAQTPQWQTQQHNQQIEQKKNIERFYLGQKRVAGDDGGVSFWGGVGIGVLQRMGGRMTGGEEEKMKKNEHKP